MNNDVVLILHVCRVTIDVLPCKHYLWQMYAYDAAAVAVLFTPSIEQLTRFSVSYF